MFRQCGIFVFDCIPDLASTKYKTDITV